MKHTFRNLNLITAGGSLINSIFYLAAPEFSLLLLGQGSNAVGLMNTRVAGACALGMSVINWQSRNVVEAHFQRIVAWGNLVMFCLLVWIEIQGTLAGALNWVGWFFVLADSLLGLGYAFFLFRSSRSAG
jgi:hypothetical protein